MISPTFLGLRPIARKSSCYTEIREIAKQNLRWPNVKNYYISFKRKTSHSAAWKVSKYGIFSGLYFPVFRLNTVFRANTGKYRPENTPFLDTFHAVLRYKQRIQRDTEYIKSRKYLFQKVSKNTSFTYGMLKQGGIFIFNTNAYLR